MMTRGIIAPIVGGTLGALLGGMIVATYPGPRTSAPPPAGSSLPELSARLDGVAAAVLSLQHSIDVLSTSPALVQPQTGVRVVDPPPMEVDPSALGDAISLLSQRVEELEGVIATVRDAFGLTPLEIRARDLGPNWTAIAEFAIEFGKDVGAAVHDRELTPADALARFGAPTDIVAATWTWRRYDADIGPDLRSMEIFFRGDGASSIAFRPR